MPATPDRVFYDLVRSGFENYDGLEGVCQLRLNDATIPDFHLCIEGPNVTYEPGVHASPRTTLTMSGGHFAHITANVQTIDFRMPEIIGGITLSGDPVMAMRVGDSILRPTAETESRLAEAEEKARRRPRVSGIERIESPTRAQVVAALEAGQPLIATGLLDDWPVLDWSVDDIKSKFGRYRLRASSATESETVGDFIERMQAPVAGPRAYSGGCVLPPAMWSLFPPPLAEATDAFTEPQLWMGAASPDVLVTSLHRDGKHGFLGQVLGNKKFVVYSPDQTEFLYPYKAFNHYQSCWVDPAAPDLTRFPKFRDAQPLEFILQPRELLIQPAGWYHCVYALDAVMSVSFFL